MDTTGIGDIPVNQFGDNWRPTYKIGITHGRKAASEQPRLAAATRRAAADE